MSNRRRAYQDAAEQALFPGIEQRPDTTGRHDMVPNDGDRDFWVRALRAALAQRSNRSLGIAEQALKLCPIDPELLLLAALTATASGKPERSLALLKR